MEIREQSEHEISVAEDTSFVQEGNPAANDTNEYLYELDCPDDYVIGVDEGTLFAIELYDANGNELSGDTKIVIQKTDRQGNPIGSAIGGEFTYDQFNKTKMRNDPDFARHTQRGILLNEREKLHVYVDADSAPDAANSRFTLGDSSTSLGEPVVVRERDSLPSQYKEAIDANTK